MALNFVKKYTGRYSPEDKQLSKAIKNIIGISPDNIFLYKLAFRHRSAAAEIKKGVKDSNERLEYLGDAILSAVVADFLFKKFPYKGEGFLTEMRSKIVSRSNLNKLFEKLGMASLIQANSESLSNNKSIFGDTFEALIGAIYLDKGYDKTKKVILNRIIKFHVDIEELENTEKNFKSKLIEWAQREKKSIEFVISDEKETRRGRLFEITVRIDGEDMGVGSDFSKKQAEQTAAEKTLKDFISAE